jgi:Zn-dependent M28 family amino/carboxypeptidase
VIILCNGGEEYGLFGADGFIRRHPLARDVRAYVYLDGSPWGAATLVYSGPGTPSLIETYAAVAPRPQGDSAFLDLIESGLLPNEGDHRPFRDAGVPGLLLGPIGDLWSPHTLYDRSSRLEPGTVQHIGETTLAITRSRAAARCRPGSSLTGSSTSTSSAWSWCVIARRPAWSSRSSPS